MSKSKYIEKVEDIPTTEHWAIITGVGVFIPGDERSRTNPGHGYPERTERYLKYEAFDNEREFLEALQRNFASAYGQDQRGIHVTETFVKNVVVGVAEA